MSHRVRTRGPVSGSVLLGALWMKKDVPLCHPNQLFLPPCERSMVGPNIPILRMTKVKSSFLCPFCKWPALCQFRENDFVLTVTTLFPLVCLPARLLFPANHFISWFSQIISVKNVQNNVYFCRRKLWHLSCSKGRERRPRNPAWLPDLVIVSHYLTFLISFHIFHLSFPTC